jgi:hypothetical protein
MFCTNSANWVNHLQPLYIAGQAFGPPQRKEIRAQQSLLHRFGDEGKRAPKGSPFDSRQSEWLSDAGGDRAIDSSHFAAEKIAILKHLVLIKRETGWKTESRAQDLRILWGLE